MILPYRTDAQLNAMPLERIEATLYNINVPTEFIEWNHPALIAEYKRNMVPARMSRQTRSPRRTTSPRRSQRSRSRGAGRR